MRLVILRTLFDPKDIVNNQCCVLVARSSIFTPVRNGITTLKVKLPVKEDDSPTASIDYLDAVGLQILEDKVPIPLISESNLIANEQPVDTYNTSALTLGGKQGSPLGLLGYRLDMQALWYPPGQHPPA